MATQVPVLRHHAHFFPSPAALHAPHESWAEQGGDVGGHCAGVAAAQEVHTP